MNVATIFIVALGVMATTIKAEGEIQCEKPVKKVGCFNNEYGYFPEKLIDDRANFDFSNVKESMERLICRCARLVAEKGYTHFTINALTQCSSGPDSGSSYYLQGRSRFCLVVTNPIGICNDNSNDPCTGRESSNYVYAI